MSPIMSFSISDSLKKVIQGLVEKKKAFNNQSTFVRAALTHFLNSDETRLELDDEIDANEYTIDGEVILSYKKGENEHRILKDILTCEGRHSDAISSFQMLASVPKAITVSYEFRGSVFEFRKFIDELDSIQDVEQLRYIINN